MSSHASMPLKSDYGPGTSRVVTGAEVLAGRGFDILKGKRVGLIANRTTRVSNKHLTELLEQSKIKVQAIFAPEHGYFGDVDAGKPVTNRLYGSTPIISLYGANTKPTAENLRDVDVLVFDIQDIGARFYTYISTMGLAMQAAAEARIPFVVLDRPNPLGGDYVAGFTLKPDQRSFVGLYEIPVAHGLTVGELANLIRGERLLPGVEHLDLTVIAMEGWQRWMRWPDTQREWVPTSPSIVDFETALIYPGVCIFEAVDASEGRGTFAPFKTLGASWADGEQLAVLLNSQNLPGVRFEPATFSPKVIPAMGVNSPRYKGEQLQGVKIIITNYQTYQPVETGAYVLQAFAQQATIKNSGRTISNRQMFNKLAGNKEYANAVDKSKPASEIIGMWKVDIENFEAKR